MSDVKQFWDNRAIDASLDDNEVTHRDIWQRWLEIDTIVSYLRKTDALVDVGCGAGYATRIYAEHVGSAVGLDFSAEMIQRAQSKQVASKPIEFFEHDILGDPGKWRQAFDVALSVRCLINILDAEKQRIAIDNIAQMLKPGGRFLFVEGVQEGRHALNDLRNEVGLPTMPTVWHNLDFKIGETLDYLQRDFQLLERRSFGTFDLISRVAHPLMVWPEDPKYAAKINEVGARLSRVWGGDNALSRVAFLVLERR
jgi:SAM-dependent methyltransferase